MSKKNSKIKLNVPSWAAGIYTIFAIALVPWTVYLAKTLPTKQVSQHWDLTWVGVDIGIMISLLITGFLASIKSRLVIIFASITGSLLLFDAWFDISSSKRGQFNESLLLAFGVEIPLALLSFYLAHKALDKNID